MLKQEQDAMVASQENLLLVPSWGYLFQVSLSLFFYLFPSFYYNKAKHKEKNKKH